MRIRWLGKSPEGSLTFPGDQGMLAALVFSLILIQLGLLWVYVNTPQKEMAVFYLFLSSIAVLGAMVELASPTRVPWAFIGVGSREELQNYISWGLMGIVIWFSAAILLYTPLPRAMLPARIWGPVEWSVVVSGLVVPVVEESFFGMFLIPSLVEKTGIIPGSAVTALAFSLMHWTVYAGEQIPLVGALVFRGIASGIILRSRSLLPGIMMHVANNVVALMGIG